MIAITKDMLYGNFVLQNGLDIVHMDYYVDKFWTLSKQRMLRFGY